MSTPVRISGTTPARTRPPGRRAASLALTAIVTTQLMLLVDATVVNVALPYVAGDLHFSATGRSWVINLYALAFGGLLLLGSRIGDRIGRRRALVTGVLAFTAASLLGGFAPSAGWLLAARAAQGAAAALAAPSTLALIATTFREGSERARALSVFSSISGAGASIGLLLGGALTEWTSWRWVMFVNVPVGLLIAWLAPRYVAETPRQDGAFDIGGALSGTLGMMSLVYGFIRVAEQDWGDGLGLTAFGLAVLLLGTFVLVELRARQPLVALRLFASRDRALAYAAMLLVPAGMFGVFYFTTLYLQLGLHFSPLRAGAAFLPMTLPLFAAARLAPRLQGRYGPKRVALAGLALNLAGVVWLSRLSEGAGYTSALLGPLVLMGVGMGLTVMQLNTLILAGVLPGEAGSASGLLQTMQQVGGGLGVAVLVTVSAGRAFTDSVAAAYAGAAVFAGLALVVMCAVRGGGVRRGA
ncbi:MFS transporter [Streptomyces sp. NPDC051940]|uniref:MFS transporter n=1 Tax=Streptomyces sp. NPDC051940 TaxID=3155675 RepID=UPI003442D11C